MTYNLQSILAGPVDEVAPRLLGSVLARELNGELLRVKIVEVEAYDQTDVASHSYRGETERTRVMFGPAGHLYVYFTYGMHYCANIVTGAAGHGSGALIRAVEPLDGEATMAANRRMSGVNIANGPAKLCQALMIDKRLNGHNLRQNPLKLEICDPVSQDEIIQTTRIGISQAKEVPWRFYLKGNPWVSRV